MGQALISNRQERQTHHQAPNLSLLFSYIRLHIGEVLAGVRLATPIFAPTLSFFLFFSLLALTSNIALAQTTCTGTETTISADVTTAQTISGANNCLVINEGVSLTVSNDVTIAVRMTSAGASLTNSGVIKTTGTGASHAIHAESTSSGVIINHLAGVIETQGAGAHGIYVLGGGNGVATVRSSVLAMGANAYAINLADTNQLDLEIGSGQAIIGGIKVAGAGQNMNSDARTHSIIIGEGATLTSKTDGFHGIELTRAENTIIEVKGSLTTIGAGAFGVYFFFATGSRLTNYGNIETTSIAGDVASAIVVSSSRHVAITNHGDVMTSGDGAHGVFSDDMSAGVIINHLDGMISTKGDGAHGVFVEGGFNGVITVKGSINAMGDGAYAINLADDNQLDLEIGSGETIIGGILVGTAGTDDNNTPSDDTDDTPRTHSIIIGEGASLITTADIGGYGIYTTGINSHITISGHIKTTGENAYAIKAENGVTLTLMSSAVIEGQIDLGIAGQDATTGEPRVNQVIVRLSSSPQTSKIFRIMNAGEITIKGEGGPVLKDEDLVVLLDLTATSAQRSALGMGIRRIHNIMTQQLLEQDKGQDTSTYYSWGYIVRMKSEREKDGIAFGFDHQTSGAIGGFDKKTDGGHNVGLFAGISQEQTDTHIKSIKIDTDGLFLGFYKQINRGTKRGWDVRFYGSGMVQYASHNMTRILQGGQAMKGDYYSTTLSPSVGAYGVYKLKYGLTLKTLMSLTHSLTRYDEYSETGIEGIDITYDGWDSNISDAKLEVNIARGFQDKLGGKGEVTICLGAHSRLYDSDDITSSLKNGSKATYMIVGEDRVSGFLIGATVIYARKKQFDLVADIDYSQADGGETSIAGRLGLKFRF